MRPSVLSEILIAEALQQRGLTQDDVSSVSCTESVLPGHYDINVILKARMMSHHHSFTIVQKGEGK
jgi:hypothetical protein